MTVNHAGSTAACLSTHKNTASALPSAGPTALTQVCASALSDGLRKCRAHNNMFPCPRVHFERLIFPWTDPALGNCSYLDTCRHMKTCRYVHYQLDDQPDAMTQEASGAALKSKASVPGYLAVRP